MTDITVGYHNDRLVVVKASDDAATTPPQELTAPSTTDRWLVEPGDNLWAIAETVIAERSATPNRGSVAAYWSALLTANADRLVDPDLIMPGQILDLPPLTAGS